MKKEFTSKAVSIMASIYLLIFIVVSLVELILVCVGALHIITFLASLLSSFCILLLLMALNNALNRIERLETALLEKKIIKEKDLEEKRQPTYTEIKEGQIDGVSLCKHCGYQIFEEDIECPNCKNKIER